MLVSNSLSLGSTRNAGDSANFTAVGLSVTTSCEKKVSAVHLVSGDNLKEKCESH